MNKPVRNSFGPRFPQFWIAISLTTVAAYSAAQEPRTLLFSLPDPRIPIVQAGAAEGYSVAVDGNIAVIGAPFRDTWRGEVKVYDTASGALLHRLVSPSLPAPETFGHSVAISGTRIVVGAPRNVTGGNFSGGTAYVFDLASAEPAVPVVQLTNPRPSLGDAFGWSVAISGTRAVVGAHLFDDPDGIVYVYDLAGATPGSPTLLIKNPNTNEELLGFGISVAISGTRLVVGAVDDNDNPWAMSVGGAFVFDLAGPTPTNPVVILSNPAPGSTNRFGRAVAISGTRAVVGAYLADDGGTATGSAYVYDLASATPGAAALTLINPSPVPGDRFGITTAMTGARLMVGAPNDDKAGPSAGSAYVFDLDSAEPTTPVLTLPNPTPAVDDSFGWSVAISGTRAVVGAPGDDSRATNSGSSYVFDLASATPTVPVNTLNVPSPEPSGAFAGRVAVSGTRILVGAPGDSGWKRPGTVYLYDLAFATPTVPLVILTNPTPAPEDRFGGAVAIDGTRAIIGAPMDDTASLNSGSAYAYDLASATPTVPVATFTNPSPASANGQFGRSVAISGTRVVVGAYLGAHWGNAHVFDMASATPRVPVVTLTNPTPALDFFGITVAISGQRVVVGAPGDDTAGSNAGIVYVYDLGSSTPAVPAIVITNPASVGDSFGQCVAISGARLVVGAVGADVSAGRAFVYDLASATPSEPVATLGNPSPAAGEFFGEFVAISGARVAVGVPSDASAGINRGISYEFDLLNDEPNSGVVTLTNPIPVTSFFYGQSVAIDEPILVVGAPGGRAYVYSSAMEPRLRMAPAAPGFAMISWTPPTGSGFVLQYTDSLVSGEWLDMPSGTANPVTVPVSNGARFYRLFQH